MVCTSFCKVSQTYIYTICLPACAWDTNSAATWSDALLAAYKLCVEEATGTCCSQELSMLFDQYCHMGLISTVTWALSAVKPSKLFCCSRLHIYMLQRLFWPFCGILITVSMERAAPRTPEGWMELKRLSMKLSWRRGASSRKKPWSMSVGVPGEAL